MDASEENFGEENFGEENFGEENFGEENFVEHDTTIIPEDPDPEEVQGQDDDSEVGDVEKRWPGWHGESVFRILVPAQKVGGIIGRKGEFIKKMCEETRARIKILDGPHGIQERAVLISAKEEPDAALPPAIDGLLRVHRRIVEGLDGDPANAQPGMVTSSRLLVPAAQAGSLIGKQGATIKSIQEASNTIVRVIGSDSLPFFALQDDRVVEIQGEPTGVHKALELVAFHLRKFLVDRSIVGVFEKQMQMPNSPMEHNMPPPHQSWGPPQGFPPNAGPAPGFGGHPQYMPPHQGPPPMRQHDSYYPPADQPPMDKQPPHQGLSMYGRDAAPMGVHSSNNAQPPPQIITQITQHMQVPLSYADAVIGTGGANISYTRRASGATVTIQETRGVPGEMTVEINGTASQVQAAQQLIQNFMADAAGASQNPAGGSVDSNYNSYPTQNSSYPTQNSSYPSQNLSYPTQNPSYPSQNSMYSSPSANAGQPAGGYGPVYGTNYGY